MRNRLAALLQAVGAMLLALRHQGGMAGHWEGTQFKAEADRRAHEMLSAGLSSMSLGLPVVSEEDPASLDLPRPEHYWLIDPLDGTASYAHGFSGFVTQAALMHGCRPVLAGVFAPAQSEMFLAETGLGAARNGQPIRVRGSLAPLVLVDNTPQPHGMAARLSVELGFQDYLESGSIGLKICRVASGDATLFFKDVVLRDWDTAPAQLVLEEAGGCLLGLDGSPLPYAGEWERQGLVAAADKDIALDCVRWLQTIGPGCPRADGEPGR